MPCIRFTLLALIVSLTACNSNMTQPKPPVAAKKPHTVASPNGSREDEYYWLRDDDTKAKRPEVMHYLEAENAYAQQMLAPLAGLQAKLIGEMKARIREDDDWVRKELEHALASGIPVIPVLISSAKVPDARKLPASLRGVFEANCGHLSDTDWVSGFEDIVGAIDRVTAPGRDAKDDPAVWHAVEPPPPQEVN